MTEQPAAITDSGTATQMAKYAARRYDRWENQKNNFGGPSDPITVTSFQPGIRLSRQQIDAIYKYDWVSAKIIDIPPADATRKWIALHHKDDPERAEIARKETLKWNLRGLVEECEKLARLYGGSLLVFGAFDGRSMEEPLDVKTIRSVEFIHIVDRFLAYPTDFYRDPMDANFGEVESYLVHRLRVAGTQTFKVHSSRVIRFDGRYVPPVERLRNFGWHDPYFVRLFEVLRQFGVSVQAGSSVLQDFVVKKMKISNLQDLISGGQWDVITSRLTLMAQEMAINNFAVYGADEDVEKMGTPIQGLSKILEMFIDYVSAASDIPRSRLFQNMTGTLGGDPGKNDLRVHYDNIQAMQETKLTPKVQEALDMILVPIGFEPGEITFTWEPLWQMSDTEQAEISLKTAQTDQIYIDRGVVEPEEVALSRFSGDTPDLTQMSIDIERREKALEDLKKVDLIRPEPSMEDQLRLKNEAQLQLEQGQKDLGDDDDPGRKDAAANLTSKGGKPPEDHRHTFDMDHDGNGQTVDTLDDGEDHVHMIRAWRIGPGGHDGHDHMIGSYGRIPGDNTST